MFVTSPCCTDGSIGVGLGTSHGVRVRADVGIDGRGAQGWPCVLGWHPNNHRAVQRRHASRCEHHEWCVCVIFGNSTTQLYLYTLTCAGSTLWRSSGGGGNALCHTVENAGGVGLVTYGTDTGSVLTLDELVNHFWQFYKRHLTRILCRLVAGSGRSRDLGEPSPKSRPPKCSGSPQHQPRANAPMWCLRGPRITCCVFGT